MQKPKIRELILDLDDVSLEQTLEFLVKKAGDKQKKTFVVTVNPEIIMLEREDPDYKKVIKSANLRTIDGVGLLWAGKMFHKSFKEIIHGVDLVEKLCEAVARRPITVGFLGGKGNVAERTGKCLAEKYPELKVAFTYEELSESELEKQSSDILFVAFGSPKQEKWIYGNLPKLNIKVAIGVGGAFDFISGKVRRAPLWVRKIGLEWLFRLTIQPWRIKRQLSLVKFAFLIFGEKFLKPNHML